MGGRPCPAADHRPRGTRRSRPKTQRGCAVSRRCAPVRPSSRSDTGAWGRPPAIHWSDGTASSDRPTGATLSDSTSSDRTTGATALHRATAPLKDAGGRESERHCIERPHRWRTLEDARANGTASSNRTAGATLSDRTAGATAPCRDRRPAARSARRRATAPTRCVRAREELAMGGLAPTARDTAATTTLKTTAPPRRACGFIDISARLEVGTRI